MKRARGVGEGTGLNGERGKNEGKRVGGRGPECTLKNSDSSTPMI